MKYPEILCITGSVEVGERDIRISDCAWCFNGYATQKNNFSPYSQITGSVERGLDQLKSIFVTLTFKAYEISGGFYYYEFLFDMFQLLSLMYLVARAWIN